MFDPKISRNSLIASKRNTTSITDILAKINIRETMLKKTALDIFLSNLMSFFFFCVSIQAGQYLSAAVEVICCGGVHKALLQVDAGVDAPGDDQFARGVDHFGPTWDHQLLPHLLYDAVLDVDVGLLGAVIVHHFATLYQDPHHRWAGRHGYGSVGGK